MVERPSSETQSSGNKTNRMISVAILLLCQMHFPLRCQLPLLKVFSSILNQSHAFSCFLSDLYLASLSLNLLVPLLFVPINQQKGLFTVCFASHGYEHHVLLCSSVCPFELQALGEKHAFCTSPAQGRAWTFQYFHMNKLPHIFSISTRSECILQHLITVRK